MGYAWVNAKETSFYVTVEDIYLRTTIPIDHRLLPQTAEKQRAYQL